MKQIFSGTVANVFSRRVRAGSQSLMFRLDASETPFLLAFKNGTRGYELIRIGAIVEVTAEPPSPGNPIRIARSVRVAGEELACDVETVEAVVAEAIQDTLF